MVRKIQNPYDKPGNWNWYKGAIHIHTANSDGAHSPSEVIKWYKERGYDFIAVTDHSFVTDTTSYKTNKFITIGGEELLSKTGEVLGLNIFTSILDEESFGEQVQNVLKQGGLAIIAHPEFAGMQFQDLERVEGYVAIEIYNNICELLNGTGYALHYWDYLLQKGRKVWGIASDDAHKLPEQGDKAWIKVKAADLAVEDILKSIEDGAFYSTQGPEIGTIQTDKDYILVKTSAVKTIRFIERGVSLAPEIVGRKITNGEYQLRGDEKYVRIEAIDARGRIAWSNPIFVQQAQPESKVG